MTDIGVATRVHGRADDALAWYRLYRNLWLWQQRSLDPRADRTFLLAFAFRNQWMALWEIIDAEERRAKVAPTIDHDCVMPSACGVTGFYCYNSRAGAA